MESKAPPKPTPKTPMLLVGDKRFQVAALVGVVAASAWYYQIYGNKRTAADSHGESAEQRAAKMAAKAAHRAEMQRRITKSVSDTDCLG